MLFKRATPAVGQASPAGVAVLAHEGTIPEIPLQGSIRVLWVMIDPEPDTPLGSTHRSREDLLFCVLARPPEGGVLKTQNKSLPFRGTECCRNRRTRGRHVKTLILHVVPPDRVRTTVLLLCSVRQKGVHKMQNSGLTPILPSVEAHRSARSGVHKMQNIGLTPILHYFALVPYSPAGKMPPLVPRLLQHS